MPLLDGKEVFLCNQTRQKSKLDVSESICIISEQLKQFEILPSDSMHPAPYYLPLMPFLLPTTIEFSTLYCKLKGTTIFNSQQYHSAIYILFTKRGKLIIVGRYSKRIHNWWEESQCDCYMTGSRSIHVQTQKSMKKEKKQSTTMMVWLQCSSFFTIFVGVGYVA